MPLTLPLRAASPSISLALLAPAPLRHGREEEDFSGVPLADAGGDPSWGGFLICKLTLFLLLVFSLSSC